jgi:AcrR family transcriptional regulator
MGEEIQRTRVLRALAEEMSQRENPHTVTVADVVARAGVSRRAFYELYTDREACFLAAFEWGLQMGAAEMYDAYARESRWQDGVRSALAALLGLLDHEPALARLCIVHALGASAPVLQRRMEALEVLGEFVDRGRLEDFGRSEPPEVAAEGVVGAVLAVIHTRLLAADPDCPESLTELLGPLMSLILLPYFGAARAGRELTRSAPRPAPAPAVAEAVPTAGLSMRLTYRTARVLRAIGERPGASNREVADEAGIVDQGQISRLLSRLDGLGLIVNTGGNSNRGTSNAWALTPRGEQVQRGAHLQARPSSRPSRR